MVLDIPAYPAQVVDFSNITPEKDFNPTALPTETETARGALFAPFNPALAILAATAGAAPVVTGNATRANGIPFQCSTGPKADPDCSGSGGSCTPYPFWADTPDAQAEPSWQDSPPFDTYAFVPYDEDSYQAYQSPGASDVWVVHGHDLAGAQATDCGGDLHYFEHFEDLGNKQGNTCNFKEPYPAQDNWCYKDHPGTGQTFGQYQCGWWRGYDNAGDAALSNSWGDIGVDAQGAKSVKPTAMKWLGNCDNCDGNDGTLHTWRNVHPQPVAWFTGVLFPWVCSWTKGDTSTVPWTGVAETKCYCDNEPWGGRNFGSTEPNHNLAVVYCAKFKNEFGMHCDMLEFKCAGGACSGAHITNKNFWVGEAGFP